MTCPSKSVYEKRRPHSLPEWVASGKRLADARKAMGLTQEQVAKLCGMSTVYYRHLEGGFNNPLQCAPKTKKAIAKALRKKVGELF